MYFILMCESDVRSILGLGVLKRILDPHYLLEFIVLSFQKCNLYLFSNVKLEKKFDFCINSVTSDKFNFPPLQIYFLLCLSHYLSHRLYASSFLLPFSLL